MDELTDQAKVEAFEILISYPDAIWLGKEGEGWLVLWGEENPNVFLPEAAHRLVDGETPWEALAKARTAIENES